MQIGATSANQRWIMDLPGPSDLIVESGVCYVHFAYEVAFSINLEDAERRVRETGQRYTIKQRRPAPSYFEYKPPPLPVVQEIERLTLGRCRSRESVDLILYDFGAVSVIYGIELGGPFSDLLSLSEELYDNAILLSDSSQRVEQLLAAIGSAAAKPNIAESIEDYVIFQVEAFTVPLGAGDLCLKHPQQIAQLLRAESKPLSDQEVNEAIASRIFTRITH